MDEETRMLEDPAFRRLLKLRSRWRWGLSGTVIGVYLVYGVAGIYFPEAYAASLPGLSMPWGMVLGLAIILLSILLSMAYVRLVNRYHAEHDREQGRGT